MTTIICNKCEKLKKHEAKGLCKNCYNKNWRKDNPDYNKNWNNGNSNYKKKWRKNKLQNDPEYFKKYEKNVKEWLKNPENLRHKNELDSNWRRTSNGKKCHAKYSSKRKRNLNWIQMFENPFDKSIKIDWHHINNAYVVAIPRELHRLYNGKYHREKVMEIVKQIYLST